MTDELALGDLRAAAIKIITSAARLRTADGQPYDMADFIAGVVSSVAANSAIRRPCSTADPAHGRPATYAS
jgi:hypothetical protein